MINRPDASLTNFPGSLSLAAAFCAAGIHDAFLRCPIGKLLLEYTTMTPRQDVWLGDFIAAAIGITALTIYRRPQKSISPTASDQLRY